MRTAKLYFLKFGCTLTFTVNFDYVWEVHNLLDHLAEKLDMIPNGYEIEG